MKLLAMLSLGFVAVAIALAPLTEESPEPEVIQLPAASTTDNQFHGFGLSVTEMCENNEKKVKAVWSSYGFSTDVQLGKDRFVYINLGRGITLNMEWDSPHSWVNFGYGTCKWGMNEYKQCGWCRGSGWSQGLVYCGPGGSRTYTTNCYVNMDAQKGADEAVQAETKLIARDPSLETNDGVQPSTTVTSLPVAEADAQEPSKTVVVVPEVVQTAISPSAAPTLILPFHFQMTEYCENGARKAKGRYNNGNVVADVNLSPGVETGIDHRVPSYPPFYIGPFDYITSKVRYTYLDGVMGCRWWDDQTWKVCGECRAGQWSSPALNCALGGSRIKDMDCSFILGVKS